MGLTGTPDSRQRPSGRRKGLEESGARRSRPWIVRLVSSRCRLSVVTAESKERGRSLQEASGLECTVVKTSRTLYCAYGGRTLFDPEREFLPARRPGVKRPQTATGPRSRADWLLQAVLRNSRNHGAHPQLGLRSAASTAGGLPLSRASDCSAGMVRPASLA
jgi:hypothetical protein